MLKFKNGIAVLVAGLMLAGCSGSGAKATETPTEVPVTEAPATTPAATETPATAATTELAPAELTWYFVGTWPQPDQDLVFAEVNKALKEKLNATVVFNPIIWGDYDQKMKVIISSGENYDLCFTSNWTNNYALNASKGAYVPLDDLLVQYAPKSFAQVPKDFWDATKIKGKIYGFVNEQISARAPVFSVPTELATKYNLDLKAMPQGDIRGFEPYLAAAVKDNPKAYFFSDFDNPAYFKQDFLAGWNIPGSIHIDDNDAKVFNQFESAEVKEFVDVLRDFNAKGYMNPDERISLKSGDDDVKNKKQVASMNGAYKPGIEAAEILRYGIPISDVPGAEPVLSTSGIVATMQAISRTSKNPERAMMLLELLNTEQEVYNLLNFGIKDKHFKLDADGFMTKDGEESAKYAPGVPWMFASNYMAYVDKGMPKDVWEQTREMNATAKRSPVLGFSFDVEPVKAEAGQCSAVIEEYAKTITLGIASKEKYDEFLAKLKEAGSDKVIAEMQKQVDEWKASR